VHIAADVPNKSQVGTSIFLGLNPISVLLQFPGC
jgi:hypothetical protein